MKHNFAKSIMMMRSQEMLHKISASLAQCHVKGELDYSLDQLIQQWQIFLGGKTKFHKGSIWARIVKNCESLFYWQVLHRSHTWIFKRMTKPSKLGGAPVRTQPHIEETTSYFSKCFLLSGTNDMPFPSPLSLSSRASNTKTHGSTDKESLFWLFHSMS